MMEGELMCNYKKCRKILNTFAWVTTCSHVFCDEDGAREFSKSPSCPACEAKLTNKYDVTRVDMCPSEQYKSMVLAGLKPDIIHEISSRALAFWSYQMHQERVYQEYLCKKAHENTQRAEALFEQLLKKTETEIKCLRTELASSKKELHDMKAQLVSLQERSAEKNRQYQKLRNMYEELKRKSVTPQVFDNQKLSSLRDRSTPARKGSHPRYSFNMQPVTRDDVLRRRDGQCSKNSNGFVFQPVDVTVPFSTWEPGLQH